MHRVALGVKNHRDSWEMKKKDRKPNDELWQEPVLTSNGCLYAFILLLCDTWY